MGMDSVVLLQSCKGKEGANQELEKFTLHRIGEKSFKLQDWNTRNSYILLRPEICGLVELNLLKLNGMSTWWDTSLNNIR